MMMTDKKNPTLEEKISMCLLSEKKVMCISNACICERELHVNASKIPKHGKDPDWVTLTLILGETHAGKHDFK